MTNRIEKFLHILLGILFIFVILEIYLFVAWWFELGTKPPDDYLKAITIVGSACGGILALLPFLHRWATTNKSANRRATENQQNSFNTAIKHLGDSTESVRLGGINSLYELAQENHQYRKRVHESLCSHARSKTNETEYKEQYKDKPSAEIQSLVDLLVKQESSIFQRLSINFERVRLQGAELQDARLQGAKLAGAQLQEAKLMRAQLQGAKLQEANLTGARLHEANLQEAKLAKAQLQKAVLWKAKLQGANLAKAKLQEAGLVEAQLQEAILVGAELQGANLERAQLPDAILEGAQLQNTKLIKAKLQGARLAKARLLGARLAKAQLQGADLAEAQLQGAYLGEAQLQGAYLEKTQLQEAILQEAQLQGAFSSGPRPVGFQEVIKSRINKDTELDHAVLEGISAPDFTEITKGLNLEASHRDFDERRQRLQELLICLRTHLNKPDIPEEEKIQFLEALWGADVGSYNKEDADKLIAEYEQAMQN